MSQQAMNTDCVIHIVDDEESIRKSLVFLLSVSGFAARAHACAGDFLALARDLTDSVLVTDLRMPDMSGIELLQRLRAMGQTMPVIIVTGHGDVQAAVEAMKAGASDFIEKPFSDDTLIATISRVCDGYRNHARISEQRRAARAKVEMLSHRERQVIDGVVAGLATKAIAHGLDLSPRTVEVYRANIMAKLQARSLAELIRIMVQVDGDEGL